MRSREWAIRCIHEASLHERNCFVTLTYADEHLPEGRSLHKPDFQKFMKRLRKANGAGIRFYYCGEYGSQYGRPHYHAILFNFDFCDKKLWRVQREVPLYTSEHLQELWPFGFSTIGSVTFESAAYVARYIMKKVNGAAADDHYDWIDPDTGEIHRRLPEYTDQSRRPGIASEWVKKYSKDIFPDDFVVIKGKKIKPPRFYDKLLEIHDPELHKEIKDQRIKAAAAHSSNQTPERLAVREIVQQSKLDRLKRTIE